MAGAENDQTNGPLLDRFFGSAASYGVWNRTSGGGGEALLAVAELAGAILSLLERGSSRHTCRAQAVSGS